MGDLGDMRTPPLPEVHNNFPDKIGGVCNIFKIIKLILLIIL